MADNFKQFEVGTSIRDEFGAEATIIGKADEVVASYKSEDKEIFGDIKRPAYLVKPYGKHSLPEIHHGSAGLNPLKP